MDSRTHQDYQDYQARSVSICNALATSKNTTDALNELSQADRAIVLIALKNIRSCAEPAKSEKILKSDTKAILHHLNHPSPSGFFGRLIALIKNLFSKITPTTIMNSFNEIKKQDIKKQLIIKNNEHIKLNKKY